MSLPLPHKFEPFLTPEPIDLSGRRLLLTGGTGFIGRTLLDYLAEAAKTMSFQVCVVSRDPAMFLERWRCYDALPWLDFHRGDIEGFVPPRGRFTDIIHAAGDTHSSGNQDAWSRQIVCGTQALLDYAVATHVERFLQLSSGAVYGPSTGTSFAEDAPLAATDTYGKAKIAAEGFCRDTSMTGRTSVVIVRLFAVIGVHMPLDGPYAAGNLLRDLLDPGCSTIKVRGQGRVVRTFLYGPDCAQWLMVLLTRGVSGSAYNVGSEEDVTIAELATRIGTFGEPPKLPSFGV